MKGKKNGNLFDKMEKILRLRRPTTKDPKMVNLFVMTMWWDEAGALDSRDATILGALAGNKDGINEIVTLS